MPGSDSELDITVSMATPVSRKRKPEEEKVYGKSGTPIPMPGEVNIFDDEEWEKWKKNELAKYKIRQNLAKKWNLTKSELPEKSDTHHILDRHDHFENVRQARKQVEEGLDSLNEYGFNVPKKGRIAIQVDGKLLPKDKCKKFQKECMKAWERAGKPTADEIWSEDEEDKKFNEQWAPKREAHKKRMENIEQMEESLIFDPWEEFVEEREADDDTESINESNYKKWLAKKIEDNVVSFRHSYYLDEFDRLEKEDKSTTSKAKKKLSAVVKSVGQFYKKVKKSTSRENVFKSSGKEKTKCRRH